MAPSEPWQGSVGFTHRTAGKADKIGIEVQDITS